MPLLVLFQIHGLYFTNYCYMYICMYVYIPNIFLEHINATLLLYISPFEDSLLPG